MQNHKELLVLLLQAVNHRQAFFLVWAAMVGGFILMMVSFYRKTTRRNFREPEQAGKSVVFDPRLPRSGAGNHDPGNFRGK